MTNLTFEWDAKHAAPCILAPVERRLRVVSGSQSLSVLTGSAASRYVP